MLYLILSDAVPALAFSLIKLVNTGIFPTAPITPSQPSFFRATLQTIKSREDPQYFRMWSKILTSMPLLALRGVISSLLIALEAGIILKLDFDPSDLARAYIKGEAYFVSRFLGDPLAGNGYFHTTISGLMLGREWSPGLSRVLVCWYTIEACGGKGDLDENRKSTSLA